MDRFFISLLLLDEIVLLGIGLLLTAAGGVVGAVLLDVKASFRRVTYLWFVALIVLGLAASQFLWLLAPGAAEYGLFSALVIVIFGSSIVFGVVLYYASAARSRHIRGDSKRAWLAFVPFANLWLTFTPGPASGPRSRLMRFVTDPLLIVGAVLVLAVSNVLSKSMEDMAAEGWSTPALTRLLAESQTVEQRFALEAETASVELPLRIDQVTTLVAVKAEGKTLRITYEVEGGDPYLPFDFEAMVAEADCAPEMFGLDIARGGTVVSVYQGPDGEIFESYEITQSDCIAGAT